MLRPPRPRDDGTPLYIAPTPGYRRLMLALLGLLVLIGINIALQDGTRLTASLTNSSAGYAHPPAPPHFGPDTGVPGPLRAARAGLDRYHRGEFPGSGLTAPGRPAASNGSAAPPPAG